MPRGIKVAGTTVETFLAFVVKPKNRKPKTKVDGNIISIPEICWFVFSAMSVSIVISVPPAKNETNN